MTPRLKGALLLLLAFGLGSLAGALAHKGYAGRAASWRGPADQDRFEQAILRRLTRELDLRPEQRERIEAALKESGREFRQLREEVSPRFRELREKIQYRIRVVLDPDQQTKFADLVAKWDRRLERRHDGGAGGEGTAGKGR